MRIPRIYLSQPLQADQDIILDARNAHYLSTVLRMKSGMDVVVFDDSGLEYTGTIRDLAKKTGSVSLAGGCNPGTESALKSILGIGISRGERMDYVIQKSTELGVSAIQPLFTEHCEVRLDERRAGKRRDHWQQVSISAAEQSGRVIVPTIHRPVPLTGWLDELTCQFKFLLDRDQKDILSTISTADSIALLVGPEGGLSENEKALAINKGFSGLSLGPRTLRTETAPVAALSLFQYLWGNG